MLVDRLSVREADRSRIVESLETALREGGGRALVERPGPGAAARLGALRVRALRAAGRRAAAAAVLVQQPLRRLPGLPRLRQPDRGRPRPGGARQAQEPRVGARSSPGTSRTTATCRRSCAASRAAAASRSTCPGRSSTSPTAGWCSRGTTTSRVCSASSAGSRGASTGCRCARSSRATAATRSAPPASARGCGPRRCASSSGAGRSATSRRCRWGRRGASWRASSSPRRERVIAARVLHEVDRRLQFLEDVGLDYLSLDRASASAVGGRVAADRARGGARHRPRRHAVRARRAVGGAAPARHRAADRHPAGAARPGQHGGGGRARHGARRGGRPRDRPRARAPATRAGGSCTRARPRRSCASRAA